MTYFKLEFYKKVLVFIVFAWALTASILLIRNKPQTLLIGVDENGLRIIRDERDRLIADEKLNFLKRYLSYAYTYSAVNYDDRLKDMGNLMSMKVWEEKEDGFKKTKEAAKKQLDVIQEGFIDEIRRIDDYHFEADLKLKITKKLTTTVIPLRVSIQIAAHQRDEENPFAWEVTGYDEFQK